MKSDEKLNEMLLEFTKPCDMGIHWKALRSFQ
jgi:hypothetical protein